MYAKVCSASMKKWLSLTLVVACAGAQATPGIPAEEHAGRVMAEKYTDQPLLSKLEQVSHRVTDRASDLVATSMGFLGGSAGCCLGTCAGNEQGKAEPLLH